MSNHIYIKAVWFERNVQTGVMEIIIDSNHGHFVLRDDVLDPKIIGRVYDYIKEKATDVIRRHLADQAQKALEASSEDRAREALADLEGIDTSSDIEVQE